MNLTKLKVGTRLGLGFSLVLFLLVVVTILGIGRMSQIQDRLNTVVSVNNVGTRLVTDMRYLIKERSEALNTLTLLTEAEDMGKRIERIKQLGLEYAVAEGKLTDLYATVGDQYPDEVALLAKIKAHRAAETPLIVKAIDLWLADKPVDATKVLLKEIRPVQRKWTENLEELSALKDKLNSSTAEDAQKSFQNARTLMLLLGGAALAIGVLAAVVITRGLLKQLGGEPDYAADIANQIAAGDLTTHIHLESGDTTSSLVAMKAMRDSLVMIVGQVRQGTDTIAHASKEIAQGNLDLSTRTELQSSSLEKTSSSMAHLTLTVRKNADNARLANQLAGSASSVASRGGAVVAEVVQTMKGINESSKRISDIISVIDGISFQTNILALNAAVEAARAGEQGRGFAVVASEVRSLAGRSAQAAKEIKSLINASVERVERGSQLVDQAGATMNEVVESIQRVTLIVSEISEASADQSDGIEQVNHSIVEMDSVTQQNAALVEQATAAAQSLEEQARELAHVVSIFKLDDSMGGRPQGLHGNRPSAVTKNGRQLAMYSLE